MKDLKKILFSTFLALSVVASSPVSFEVFVLKAKKEHAVVRHKGVTFKLPYKLLNSKKLKVDESNSLKLGQDQWIKIKKIYLTAAQEIIPTKK